MSYTYINLSHRPPPSVFKGGSTTLVKFGVVKPPSNSTWLGVAQPPIAIFRGGLSIPVYFMDDQATLRGGLITRYY